MDKGKLNWSEVRFAENLEWVFGVVILEWLNDIRDGNDSIVPETLEEAKQKILEISKEWSAVPPYGKREEWEMYYMPPRVALGLIRENIERELINDLFLEKDEVLELGLHRRWFVW